MEANEALAAQFEQRRGRLRAVAFRMLGSTSEADDAVQESWLRLSRTDPDGIDNLDGWLTTVVSRVCLDLLRSRRSRREDPLEHRPVEASSEPLPEDEAMLADSVSVALMVVLERLRPAERLAFVLHDLFAVPFDEIGPMMQRSPAAVRQLASRGRRRVQGIEEAPVPDAAAQREVVSAFLTASRSGDFDALVALLDPEAVARADAVAVASGAEARVVGADAVARTFAGRARAARLSLLDGYAGLVWSVEGRPRVVFAFTVEEGRIVEIELLADPDHLARLDLADA